MHANIENAQPIYAALFISDLHLQQSHPKTTEAFFDFLRRHAMCSRQLYILGDLFESWAGDDYINSAFHRKVVRALRELSDSGIEIHWIAGNRDFLVGEGFARATGMILLPDPYIAVIAGRRIALTHGDAQCIDDQAYVDFRSKVRNPEWQKQFLAMPLEQRKSIIEGMRKESRKAQYAKTDSIMDVSPAAIAMLFEQTGTSIIIHGHTHRPARHEYASGSSKCNRYVLPDWEYDSDPVRGGWIAIGQDGLIRQFGADGFELPSS